MITNDCVIITYVLTFSSCCYTKAPIGWSSCAWVKILWNDHFLNWVYTQIKYKKYLKILELDVGDFITFAADLFLLNHISFPQ